MLNETDKSFKKFSISKKNIRLIVFLVLAIGFPFYYKLIIFGSIDPKLPSQQMVTGGTKETKTICEGDESCISKVRDNYTSSGEIILGEEYLGNGIFGISFLDPSKGEDFNSQVKTDCNCTILNVQIEPMR